MVIGFIGNAVVSLLLLRFKITGQFWLFFPALLSIYFLCRNPAVLKIDITGLKPKRNSLFSALIIIGFFGIIAWQGFLMARGDFPRFFFNVDSGYYLSQVNSLINALEYPPSSFMNTGYTKEYHYAVQSMAALLSKTTGLAPHKSLFGVVFPLILTGKIAILVVLRRRIAKRIAGPLFYTLMLFVAYIPAVTLYTIVNNTIDSGSIGHGLQSFVANILENPKKSYAYFPLLSTHLGQFLFMVIVYCTFHFQVNRNRYLLVVCTTLLISAKAQIFIGISSGLILISAVRAMRGDFSFFKYCCYALLCAATIQFLLSSSGTGSDTAIRFSPWFYFMALADDSIAYHFPVAWNVQLITKGAIKFGLNWSAPLLVVFIGCLYLFRTEREGFIKTILALSWVVGPLVFVNMFVLEQSTTGININNFNILQVLDIVPVAFSVVLVRIFNMSVRQKRGIMESYFAVVILVGFLVWVPVLQIGYGYITNFKGIHNGFQFVDNRSIAEALKKIPVKGSVIVSNDYRYPTYTDKNDLRQMQIPSLFGHQAYSCNFAYETVENISERLDEYRLLQKSEWSPKLDPIIREKGWTHFLVNKAEVYPRKALKGNLIFENQKYLVYQLVNHE